MNGKLQQSSSTDTMQGKQKKAGRRGNDQVKWRSTNQLNFNRSCDLETTIHSTSFYQAGWVENRFTSKVRYAQCVWSKFSHFNAVIEITQILKLCTFCVVKQNLDKVKIFSFPHPLFLISIWYIKYSTDSISVAVPWWWPFAGLPWISPFSMTTIPPSIGLKVTALKLIYCQWVWGRIWTPDELLEIKLTSSHIIKLLVRLDGLTWSCSPVARLAIKHEALTRTLTKKIEWQLLFAWKMVSFHLGIWKGFPFSFKHFF